MPKKKSLVDKVFVPVAGSSLLLAGFIGLLLLVLAISLLSALVFGWPIMIAIGVFHSIWPSVPALGYFQTVAVVFVVSFVLNLLRGNSK